MFDYGMVSTPQPEASEAGVDILRAGGNALDAAVASALVQSVVDPLMCGVAGFGSLALYLPDRGVHTYFDFHAPAPKAARPDMWESLIEGETRDGWGFILKGSVNEIGYQSICVPSTLRGLHDAHREYGKLPWKELFAAAIAYAEDGWSVRPHVHSFWSDQGTMGRVNNDQRISFTPAVKELYCRPDGTPKRVGDTVRNGDYANVLRQIAKGGADAFYKGEIAAAIADDMKSNGGLVTTDDLASFRPTRNEPLRGRYRDHEVTTNQPPGGGIMLLQMLNTLENFDLRAMEHNSVDYIKTVAEAMKLATIDKENHIGDPAFLDVPTERLTSKSYAQELATKIRAGHRAEVTRVAGGIPSKDTTQVSVVDRHGGCVSLTHSLGNPSGVVTEGLGFMYNGCMGIFDPRPGRAGSIAPGKARFSSMCPSILFKNGKPSMVIGAPGATQIAMGVLQSVINRIDFDMSMQEAISATRFSATSNIIDLSNRVPRATERELRSIGYETVRSALSYTFAWVHGIAIEEGGPSGGVDPATDGIALRT
ncbi:gamma-glutamyltransferase [Bradyrhizobium sp.]|uniref:gamma-glutamyltransferase n=1 Tax=Bradyrhizobium sp. TaxID=376 RepID=UPI0039E4F3E3